MTTPAARGARSFRAEARSFVRACSTTWWPSEMRVSAAPRPRPSVDPVMKTRRMVRSFPWDMKDSAAAAIARDWSTRRRADQMWITVGSS
jgi:hypothetical protein